MDARAQCLMQNGFAWTPVSWKAVTIDDAFGTPRLDVNRERTIPFAYSQCKQTGRLDALRLTWKPGETPVPHIFWDSDIAKWLEAASYSWAPIPIRPSTGSSTRLSPCSRLPNSRTAISIPISRSSSLVNAGLTCVMRTSSIAPGTSLQAGVAHFEATGSDPLGQRGCPGTPITSIRCSSSSPARSRAYRGHEEIELALVKLYRATGILTIRDWRSTLSTNEVREPCYFDREAADRGTPGYFEVPRASIPALTGAGR